jgi:Protein of unknown function (DUF1570)
MKRKSSLLPIVVVVAIASVLLYWRHWIHEQRIIEKAQARALVAKRSTKQARATHPAPLPGAKQIETTHYVITTTADASQTQRVAEAVEALYAAYGLFFKARAAAADGHGKLKLTLYAFQAQFKANNYSMPWAEAYYLRPVCYAYYAKGEPNPYHWMIHEATHQLNAEVSGFRKAKWIDEGLATYFGTSRIERGRLVPGEIDPDTYPIWWLSNSGLTGSLDADIEAGRWIPIRALITGRDAPNINSNVNRYYIQYWSLTHFLFNYDNGRYAEAYKRLISEGGSLANFEKIIGPADRIEYEWYRYLSGKISAFAAPEDSDEATTVVWNR